MENLEIYPSPIPQDQISNLMNWFEKLDEEHGYTIQAGILIINSLPYDLQLDILKTDWVRSKKPTLPCEINYGQIWKKHQSEVYQAEIARQAARKK